MTAADRTILSRIHSLLQYLPYAAIMSSILVLSLLALLGKYDILPYALTLLIPVILVSVLYIWKKSSITKDILELPPSFRWINIPQRYFLKIWGIIFCFALVWVVLNPPRDAVFVICAVLLFSLAAIQVFLRKFNPAIIIIQLMIASLFCVWTQMFGYFYFADGDSLGHVFMANTLLENGFLINELFGDYGNYAMMHITMVIGSLMMNLTNDYSHWILITISLTFASVFVYGIAKSFTQSKRIAVLSVFFYCMTPVVLNYILRAAPRSLSTLGFVVLVFLFLKNNSNKNPIPIWVCSVIMTIYMILAHHAQLVFLIAIMTIIAVSYYIYQGSFTKTQKGILFVYYMIPLLYYLFTYLGNIVGILKKNFFGVLQSTSITELNTVESSTFGLSNFLGLIAGMLMLAVILFGLYYIVMPRNQKSKLSILWPLTLLLFAVFIPGVADAFSALSMMEQIGRLQIVLTPLFAVVMTIGLLVLGAIVAKGFKKPKSAVAVMVIFCILLVAASPILSNSRDSSVFEGTLLLGSTNSYEEEELVLLEFVNSAVSSGSKLYADYLVTRYYTTKSGMQSIDENYYSFPAGNPELFTEADSPMVADSYLLFRKDTYLTRGISVTDYGGNNAGKAVTRLKYNEEDYARFLKNINTNNQIVDVGSAYLQYQM